MAKPVTLSNGREWKTRTAAEAHFRDMLHRYENGAVVEDPTDHDDLSALLERYDTAIVGEPSKIGSGIAQFERRVNSSAGFSTPGFWVVRTDGTATDFSFYTGVKGVPKPRSQEFADACRAAVAEDLRAAKKRHFERYGDSSGRVPCDLTDQLITIQEAHLDHAHPPFGHMVVMFRAARGLPVDIPDGVVSPPSDGQTTSRFIDPEVARAFREFHHNGAKLRVVAAARNLAMAASQRAPKIKRLVEI